MKRIFIIYTGGTIGMESDPKTGALRPVNFDEVLTKMPELQRLNHHITIHSFQNPIDSSNMSPSIWAKLAQLIADNYHSYDGFVVLHGSDTMAYTASALSFMLDGLNKAIVLTGAQLPAGSIRSDASKNLITAIEIASAYQQNQALVPEVSIYFDYQLYRGNRTIKYSSHTFEAFRSPNYPLLAEAGVALQFYPENIRQNHVPDFAIQPLMNPSISVLKLYPGISAKIVNSVLNAEVETFILETFGAGNTCSESWFLNEIATAQQRGKIIVNRSQCVEGAVEMGRYETSVQLTDLGVINGYDMTFESCVTKLMHLLAYYPQRAELQKQIAISLRGELSKK